MANYSQIIPVTPSYLQQEQVEDNFPYFFIKTYVMTSYLNCLAKTVLMRGQNMYLFRNKKDCLNIILKTQSNLELWCSGLEKVISRS